MSDTEEIKPLYLTVKQAARRLNIGTTTLRQLIAYQGLPVVRFNRCVRINPERLDEWRVKREQEQSA